MGQAGLTSGPGINILRIRRRKDKLPPEIERQKRMDEKDQIKGSDIPDPKEIEKEINDFLAEKYGNRIRVMGTQIGPWHSAVESEGGMEVKEDSDSSSIRFDMKPAELHDYLDRFVIRQDAAKEVLATKMCTHFNRIRYFQEKGNEDDSEGIGRIKNNIILIGPTGVGKTYLIKLIARKLGVPFVKGDATKFTETGYVGGDVEDLVRDLVQEADGDIDRLRETLQERKVLDFLVSQAQITRIRKPRLRPQGTEQGGRIIIP